MTFLCWKSSTKEVMLMLCEHGTLIKMWDSEAPHTPSLLAQLHTYQALFTTLVEQASKVIPLAHLGHRDKVSILDAVLVYGQMLNMQFPPVLKFSHGMIASLSSLMECLQQHTAVRVVTMECLYRFMLGCLERTFEVSQSVDILNSMPEHLLRDMSLSAVSLYRKIIISSGTTREVPQTFIRLLKFRTNTSRFTVDQAHIQRILSNSEAACAEAARLGIVALTTSALLSESWTPHIQPFLDCGELLLASNRVILSDLRCAARSRDATLINSLITVGRMYPGIANGSRLIYRLTRTKSHFTSGEAAVQHSGLYSCVTRANEILQRRKQLVKDAVTSTSTADAAAKEPTSHLRFELLTLLECTMRVSVWISRDKPGPLTPGLSKLVKEVHMPGILTLLEEFARGADTTSFWQCMMHISSLYEMITYERTSSNSSSSSDATLLNHTFRLSAAITARKLILRMVGTSPIHAGWVGEETHRMAANMLETLHNNVTESTRHSRSHQIYTITGVTLRTLLVKCVAPHGVVWCDDCLQHLNQEHSIIDLDCVQKPALWSSCVETCASLFNGTRLLPRCGHIGCINLDGVMDAGLKTLLCSGCRRTSYCSVECQRADWVVGGHRKICGKGSEGSLQT